MRTLSYIGKADFGYPAYKDEDGRLWANINYRHTDKDGLYSLTGNSLEGEPNEPFPVKIGEIVVFEGEPDPEQEQYKFQYQLLSRLKSDCDYYLGCGNWYEKHLWAGDEEKQIAKMKEIWNILPEGLKPEWLSMTGIENYEKRLLCAKRCKETYGHFPHMKWINLKTQGVVNEAGFALLKETLKEITPPCHAMLMGFTTCYDAAVHVADCNGHKVITAIVTAVEKGSPYCLSAYDMDQFTGAEGAIVDLRVNNMGNAKRKAEDWLKYALRVELMNHPDRVDNMFPRYFCGQKKGENE